MLDNNAKLSAALKKEALKQGFNPVGIANIPGTHRIRMRTDSLQRWLERGNQADMKWMEAKSRIKTELLLKGVKSVLVVGLNYFTKPENNTSSKLKIARYAWGNDYHKTIEKRLKKLGKWLQEQRPNSKWKICVDSKPLLEKAWAEEAGLGWIGKNSNLIHSTRGSWMVLGNLLSTEELIADQPSKPLCGKCEKCIEACPTNAISEPFVINSKKCIAYHNIENRNEEIPLEIQKLMGNWIVGCDICQDICPWNQEGVPISEDPDMKQKAWIKDITIKDILNWNDERWKNTLKGSSLKRIKPWMWRRNANYILKNNNQNKTN